MLEILDIESVELHFKDTNRVSQLLFATSFAQRNLLSIVSSGVVV